MRVYVKQSVAERFWPKVDRGAPDSCWLWRGAKSGDYGSFYTTDRTVYAHRVAYELLIGPVPEGQELDHLCRNPGCVNPAHLEPVTHRENVLRGASSTAANARKTHCIHGHEFTPENTYWYGGGKRSCRICRRRRRRECEAREACGSKVKVP